MLDDWRGLRTFRLLPAPRRAIVFYSEGRHDWPHLRPLVSHLTHDLGESVCYVASEQDDPGLVLNDERVTPIQIGQGTARTVFFLILDAGVVVMSMPDLNTYHIKRSIHSVHYVYIFHSMVSSHMMYRRGAFDHFDTLFCVGPHHVREVRETEALYNVAAKDLFEHGYGRLDSILNRARQHSLRGGDRPLRVLIAPSWGVGGILQTCGVPLVDAFLADGFHVTVRPHPQLRRNNPGLLASYRERSAGQVQVVYDDDVVSQDSLHNSDLMVSDWSGVALEFAFGLERPVLFMDVPRKVNNADYIRYVSEPIEVALRPELGAVLTPDRLAEAPALARRMIAEGPARSRHLADLRARWIFNVGTSGARGAEKIANIAAGRAKVGLVTTLAGAHRRGMHQ
jgi:CDP-Glycerol:Poly(glycerophosphate) glycerophosphotransferase